MISKGHVFESVGAFRDFLDGHPELYEAGDVLHDFLEKCAFFKVCCKCDKDKVKNELIILTIQIPIRILPVQKSAIKQSLDVDFVELYYNSERLFRL
jgi:hypothetical protein